MSSSQEPCLNNVICEYKNPLLLETWPQALELANLCNSLVPGSSGMCLVECVVKREGWEVSCAVRTWPLLWVGMKPQEIRALVGIQASCIPVTNVRGVIHPV